jgi:hypothetical protein
VYQYSSPSPIFDAWRRGVLIAPAHRRDFFDQLAHEAELRERRGDSTPHVWRLQAQRAHDEYLLRRIVDATDDTDDTDEFDDSENFVAWPKSAVPFNSRIAHTAFGMLISSRWSSHGGLHVVDRADGDQLIKSERGGGCRSLVPACAEARPGANLGQIVKGIDQAPLAAKWMITGVPSERQCHTGGAASSTPPPRIPVARTALSLNAPASNAPVPGRGWLDCHRRSWRTGRTTNISGLSRKFVHRAIKIKNKRIPRTNRSPSSTSARELRLRSSARSSAVGWLRRVTDDLRT